ncbi:MAG: DNA topoisomerase I [Thermoprotei archaeon]
MGSIARKTIEEWLREYMSKKVRETRVSETKYLEKRAVTRPLREEFLRIWSLRGKVVVIAEKPKAADKIAYALSRSAVKKRMYGIPYYVISSDGLTIYVAPAAGHLYGLDTDKRGYPVFEYEWKPLYLIDPSAKHTYKFLQLLSKLCREANYYVNACDYDIEGSVIGYLIIKFHGDLEKSFRAKFSSLTPDELKTAFNKLTKLDWEMIESGLCRHELDWIWGINISRALMSAIREVTGKKIVLSAGRVQTPTLKRVVENAIERNLFVPVPQYALVVDILKSGIRIHLEYKGPTIESRRLAEEYVREIKSTGYLVVKKFEEKKYSYTPPPAFNLGDLQSEAARIYGFSPYKTQSIAEKLYLEALISYPRTNSQKLPPTLNYRGIMEKLAKIPRYSNLVSTLLSETRGVLKPVQGPKEDPAHPAIYPTGIPPSDLSEDEWKIYDLIVRRFLAAFAPKAIVSHRLVVLVHPSNPALVFQATGQEAVVIGWFKYYPFLAPEERKIPVFRIGEEVEIVRASYRKTYTKPPERMSKIKILKWMEEVGIGTEATRARIIELLFKRKYLKNVSGGAEVTDLGFGVIEVLDEFFPELTSVGLTRYFEEELEKIRLGQRKREEVVADARKTILQLLTRFDEYKHDIGMLLAIRYGLIEPSRKCIVCNREEWRDNLCKYHYMALEEIKKKYEEWRKREELSWEEYLRQIARLKSTGKWVREVIKTLYRGLV